MNHEATTFLSDVYLTLQYLYFPLSRLQSELSDVRREYFMSLPIERGKSLDAVERRNITIARETRRGSGKHFTREGLLQKLPVILTLDK